MDVWVEFKNASKWQAELLFRNFFPSTDEEDIVEEEGELEGIELPTTPPSPSVEEVGSPASTSFSSMFSSLALGGRSRTESNVSLSSFTNSTAPSVAGSSPPSSTTKSPKASLADALKNQAYLPPAADEEIEQFKHSAPALDSRTLSRLAKEFADSIPDEEFSVAALQGCESSPVSSSLC